MVAYTDNASAQSDFQSAAATMVLTLPDSKAKVRRAPVTPPSVTPPSVSTDISLVQQLERDRCKSPTQLRASALLAKVAVLPSVPSATAPMPTASGMSSPGLTDSNSSSPASSPPGEGDQFFGTFPKELPCSPNGGYISFPDFDRFGGDCTSDEEESLRKLQSLKLQ
ncbi:hypothetical protein L211DRAFT_121859 [Terfezia boudieri ATCC MYA-4762]|uniref:Uncharacterized protein n=1 Tax=Terfezia boudieri ATCC MYA-4762 TaxID=1051890 RepID=A0A3N4LR60_9PEZI|nr:hypothetical protein L211DRAFT_121859 [Terfezia boudieri ATCC MYA-4762]